MHRADGDRDEIDRLPEELRDAELEQCLAAED
jgi:hypothetical protein